MTSSEDVILQIPEVRFKKGDGTLYIMNKRLAWILDNKDKVMVSHNYEDVKAQKISPEGRPKVQLQLVLHNGLTSVFHFINKDGPKSQVSDRNKVKDLLAQLLPKFKRKIDKDLEEKNKLLSSNPVLFRLYRDLVISGIMNSKDFWSRYVFEKVDEDFQSIGISGAFLTDIKPQTDGFYGLKYNVTKETIESIFKTYPAVHRKFLENVPMKISDNEFWTKFFQSHYFHRDRVDNSISDLFTECKTKDDDFMKKDIEAGVDDPTLNLMEFEDYGTNIRSNEEQYVLNKKVVDSVSVSKDNLIYQSIIKQFNQHSIMVLKASSVEKSPIEIPSEKIRKKIAYNDLIDESKLGDGLNFSYKIGGYVNGICNGDLNNQSSNSILLKKVNDPIKHKVNLLRNPEAVSVLGELSPGGVLMKSFQQHAAEHFISKDIKDEFRGLYISFSELLKQLYSCFPVPKEETGEKLSIAYNSLRKLHDLKLKPFEDKIVRELSPMSSTLTIHLNQMLNEAYNRYIMWEKKQIKVPYR